MGLRAPIVGLAIPVLAACGAEVWTRTSPPEEAVFTLPTRVVRYDSNHDSVYSLPIENLSPFPIVVRQDPASNGLKLIGQTTIPAHAKGTLSVMVSPLDSLYRSEQLNLVLEPGRRIASVDFRFGVPFGRLSGTSFEGT